MSEIFNKIKKESIKFRKEKSPFAPVSVHLISSITSYVKDNQISDVTDDIAIKVIRSQLKKANDLRNILVDTNTDTTDVDNEIKWLTCFLPKETSKEEIIFGLGEFFETNEKSIKSMGKAMAFLKEKFGSSLNASSASSIVKEYIA